MSKFNFVTNSEIFFLRMLIPFCGGIFCVSIGSWFNDLSTVIYVLTSSIICCLFLLNIFYLPLKIYRFKTLIGFLIYLLAFASGMALTIFKSDVLASNHFSRKSYQYFKIVVNQEPQKRNTVLMFKAKVISGFDRIQQHTTVGNILVSVQCDISFIKHIQYGDILVIPNTFQETRANPNPATFDYKRWLAMQHIHHQVFLKEAEIYSLPGNHGNWLIQYALQLRTKQVKYFRKILKDDNVYAVASTLILGYRADLDEEVIGYYAKTGTIHALSVSGMHVGLIYIVLNWVLVFLNRKRLGRITKTCLILILIWSYTMLTGLSPSVLRSAIMISVFVLGKQINRSANGINILTFSALLILINDPLIIWDAGFQLSYLAVLGLILFQSTIENWNPYENLAVKKLWSAISISLAAQLFTFPLSIYYFHQFPIYFLISNLFIIIPVTGIMYLGILVLIFRLTFLAGILEWLIMATNMGLKFIAELPLASISSIWISPTELLLITVLIAGILIGLYYYSKRLLMYSLILFLCIQIFSSYGKFDRFSQKKLVIFNIRNNYAVGFISGYQAVVYSKLQVSDKLFKKNIQPYFDQLGVNDVTCTDNLSTVNRSYLHIFDGEIQFFDYSMNELELRYYKMGINKAIVKNIE